MKYQTTLIVAALFCGTAAAGPEAVTCDSPCDCHDAHGEGRWSVKTDASLPPTDASAIQAVTPSEIPQGRKKSRHFLAIQGKLGARKAGYEEAQ
jgi:hypothetical protein